MTTLSYFPIVQEEAELIDLLSRAAWFLSFCPIDCIYVPIATARLKSIEWCVAPGMDVSIAKNFDLLQQKVVFVVAETESDLDACMTEASIVLRWKKDSVPDFVSTKTLTAWERGKKVLQVDPVAIRQEGSYYIEVGLHLLASKPQLIDENKRKFAKLAARLEKFDQAYLMATGPSVENYRKFDFTNALSIVCNSVILDEELMLRVRPQILVFADPIFHFGPSEYAATFRKKLLESTQEHDYTICIPFKYYALFVSAVPELSSRTIGIPFVKEREFNFDLTRDFMLKTTANILTFLMVPLATTFARKIGFLGCDGRPLTENTYFWNHNPNTQFNDKMANIRGVHPGFFAIDYNDYYVEHCRLLGEQLQAGEKAGHKFECLAFSHVPPLAERMIGNASLDHAFAPLPDNIFPRLLVIDSTRIDSVTATGQIKKKLLEGWPQESFLQIYAVNPTRYPLAQSYDDTSSDVIFPSEELLLERISEFKPEIIYYRPLIDKHPLLHALALKLIEQGAVPLVTHIMDDWPSELAASNHLLAKTVHSDLQQIFSRSHKALSISEKMSVAFEKRYGTPFEIIANGIVPDDCQRIFMNVKASKVGRKELLIRYCGALAENMTLQTIIDVAIAVDALQEELPLRFEVYTMKMWRAPFEAKVRDLKGVFVFESVPNGDYPRLIAEADVLVLGYNFDEKSIRYIQYSMPNKLPEYLGAGVAILGVGPLEAAGIDYLFSRKLACCVTKRNSQDLGSAIRRLAIDVDYRNGLANHGQQWAFENLDIREISKQFQDILCTAAAQDLSIPASPPSAKVSQSLHILIFYPTLTTVAERKFWNTLLDRLRERGYHPIIISFMHDNNIIASPRIFMPSPFALLPYLPDFQRNRSSYMQLCDVFKQVAVNQKVFDALVESTLSQMSVSKVNASAHFEQVAAGADIFVGYLLDLMKQLTPSKVIINNDTLPLHLIGRYCAQSLSIPVIHSERSPIGNQWFEPDGFYANSRLATFLANAPWDKSGPHEEIGKAIVERLSVAPASHRAPTQTDSAVTVATTIRKKNRRTFLLALDAIQNTGWAQKNHPLRDVNYPLFKTPEEAVSHLADIARNFSATLVVKPHPSDQYGKHMYLPEGVELFEGDIAEALASADVVFCFLTKVAFAAMAIGKPLVTLGPNVAALSGIPFHCTNVKEIEQQIERALASVVTGEIVTRVCRFMGYLGQHYFIENELDNDGASRLLNMYFPVLGTAGKTHLPLYHGISEQVGLMNIDAMAPDRMTTEEEGRLELLGIIYGPFSRARDRRIEEVDIVDELFKRQIVENFGLRLVMVDVGACQGDAFKSFLESDWLVHAFEPNPPMYEKTRKKYATNKNVMLNQLAVSDNSGDKVPFYTSEESIGISSLSAFRDSHRETAVVETIRLDDYCSRMNIHSIDFLKVDTEGFDLMVLQGIDWGLIQPRVIVCEFENAKTKKLGYFYEDIAQYLHSRGYQVFVSEWHPITRYGSGEHRWRAMHQWPASLIDRNAWGNLIAFREPVAVEMIELATRHAVNKSSLVFAQKARLEAIRNAGTTHLKPPLAQSEQVVLGPFLRVSAAHWDETNGIAELFAGAFSGAAMIDVGAHYGSALFPFLNKGWKIFAFEPDEKNRAKLLERLAKHKDQTLVSLDTRCVSNKSQKGVSFFTSKQSTGISGLSAFHESHVEAQKVDITTLTEFFQDRPLPAVDFLKIDTEGHDLFVLQGFPWERGKPAVIECEFEDTKTVPLGYTFHDLARFLVDKGYSVYVSEWHPIIRYGIRHDWNQLLRYPCELADSKGWGNLLAFRDPIDETDLVAAVNKVLKVGAGDTAKKAVAPSKPASAPVSSKLDGMRGFSVKPSPFFTPIAPNQWRYTHADAAQKLWVATIAAPGPTAGRTFAGCLRVQSDRAMTVNVSLGRHGQSDYEGTAQRVKLVPGEAQNVKLSKRFDKAHEAFKLQAEVLDMEGGGTAVLAIDGLGVNESLASIRDRLGKNALSLREANRLFREGDMATSMGMYLLLSEQRPLKMYADNAVMAARRAGMPWVKAVGELAWVAG